MLRILSLQTLDNTHLPEATMEMANSSCSWIACGACSTNSAATCSKSS